MAPILFIGFPKDFYEAVSIVLPNCWAMSPWVTGRHVAMTPLSGESLEALGRTHGAILGLYKGRNIAVTHRQAAMM